MVSPYTCDYYGKNLDDIQDDEFKNCPGQGCAECDLCNVDYLQSEE